MKARADEANRDGVTKRVSGKFFLQRRWEEMLVECGEEDGEQGEGKAEWMRTRECVWHLEWHLSDQGTSIDYF